MAASAPGSAWDSDDAMEVDDAVATVSDDLAAPSQMYTRAIPTAPYTFRIPEAPDIQSNYPHPYSNSKGPGIRPSEKNLSHLKLNPQDLRDGTCNNREQRARKSSLWQHKMRDEAQALLDYMFLGPTKVLTKDDFLVKNDFSLAVVIRNEKLAHLPSNFLNKALAAFPGMSEMKIDKLNWSTSELCGYIGDLNKHMVDKKKEGRTGKILITCETGNASSALLATCYIMAVYDMSWEKARSLVFAQRGCVDLGTAEMKLRLEAWQNMLKAGVDVAASGATIEDQKKRQKSKRGADNMLNSDVHHDDGGVVPDYDADRFRGREPFAPFMEMD